MDAASNHEITNNLNGLAWDKSVKWNLNCDESVWLKFECNCFICPIVLNEIQVVIDGIGQNFPYECWERFKRNCRCVTGAATALFGLYFFPFFFSFSFLLWNKRGEREKKTEMKVAVLREKNRDLAVSRPPQLGHNTASPSPCSIFQVPSPLNAWIRKDVPFFMMFKKKNLVEKTLFSCFVVFSIAFFSLMNRFTLLNQSW